MSGHLCGSTGCCCGTPAWNWTLEAVSSMKACLQGGVRRGQLVQPDRVLVRRGHRPGPAPGPGPRTCRRRSPVPCPPASGHELASAGPAAACEPGRSAASCAAMNSSTVQSAMSLPRPMTSRWSAVFSISDIRWLDTKTVRPSAASAFIRFLIHRMPSGSSPLTGSSNMRIWPGRRAARRRCRGAGPCRGRSPWTASWRPPPARPGRAPRRSGALGRLLDWARQSRWLRALRPPCTALASSSAPDLPHGLGHLPERPCRAQ